LIVLFGLTSSQAIAQIDFNWGVKAAANMSNYILKNVKHTDSKMNIGASAGGFVNLGFSEAFSLQPEVMFHFNTSEMKDKTTGKKYDYEYWGVEVPIYFVASMPMSFGKNRVYAGAGPYVGYGFSLKDTTADINLYKEDQLKEFDFGWTAMIGYEFGFGLQINAGYKMGLTDLTDKIDGKMRTQGLNLGIGYRF